MRFYFVLFSIVGVFFSAFVAGANATAGDSANAAPDVAKNVALGKAYSLFPKPNYRLCSDAADDVQLTDGATTASYFWTQPGTVGWQNAPFAEITIDLEKTEPIDRVSFTCAAGRAGVKWPRAAVVFVGEDGETFYRVGDVFSAAIRRDGAPSDDEYSIQNFVSEPLNTKGRFVKLLVVPTAPFFFTDEIRVERGADALLETEFIGETTTSARDFAERYRLEAAFERRYDADAQKIVAFVDAAAAEKRISESKRVELTANVEKIRAELAALPIPDPKSFKAILPFNDAHRRLFAVQAEIWRTETDRDLTVAVNNCWDPIRHIGDLTGRETSVAPTSNDDETRLDLLQNETRYLTYSLYNSGAETLDVSVSLRCDAFSDENVATSEILWTDTKSLVPVARAIAPPVDAPDGTATFSVLPGLPKQIWFAVSSDGLAPGDYSIDLAFDISEENGLKPTFATKVPLTVYPLEAPKNATLISGGWDYSERDGTYSATPTNIDSFVQVAKEYRVNGPWARNGVLFDCRLNPKTGELEVETAAMERWLKRWEGAREYFVFVSVGETFLGAKIGTEEFKKRVGDWARFWRDWLAEKGFDPTRFNFLLADEPGLHAPKLAPLIVAWAKILKDVAPEFRVWEDPVYQNPADIPADLAAIVDVFCPNRPQWLANPDEFEKFYFERRAAGKTLALYSCSGSVCDYDLWGYWLLQSWQAFQIGANASFFWALGDGGGASSWNEYVLAGNSYSPMFIDPEDSQVIPGKPLAAMKIGVQDYEVLFVLKGEIERIESSDANSTKKAAALGARRFLDDALRSVLDGQTPESPSDRTFAPNRGKTDAIRRAALRWILDLRRIDTIDRYTRFP